MTQSGLLETVLESRLILREKQFSAEQIEPLETQPA